MLNPREAMVPGSCSSNTTFFSFLFVLFWKHKGRSSRLSTWEPHKPPAFELSGHQEKNLPWTFHRGGRKAKDFFVQEKASLVDTNQGDFLHKHEALI